MTAAAVPSVAKQIVRRDVELMIVSVLVGPPMGALMILFAVAVLRAPEAELGARLGQALILAVNPIVHGMAYFIGIVPAAASAALGAWASRRLPPGAARLAAAPGFGALATAAAALAFAGLTGGPSPDLEIELALILTGAGSALACTALVERFRSEI